MQKAADSPFWCSDETGPLVARDADIGAAIDVLTNASRLLLTGWRHFGKSSVLSAAAAEVTNRGVAVLRYDVEAFESIEALAREMGSGATRLFATSLEHAGEIVRRFFAPLGARASYDFTSQQLTIEFDPSAAQRRRPILLLTAVLDGIEQLAATHGRPTAVVLDEFHEIITDGGDDAVQEIRSTIGAHRYTGYVFASSRVRLLSTGPLTQLGELRVLSPIPRHAFQAFLRRGFALAAAPIDDTAVDRILDAADEVPLNVQWLASECWDDIRLGHAEALTISAVETTLDRITGEHHPHYMQIWAMLTSAQRRTLKAIANEPSGDFRLTDVAAACGLAPSTMQRTLAALEERSLIRYVTSDSGAERGSQWRLGDPFFARWLARAQASN
jgi:DNA-binding MarR family transcriptional regulator